MTPAATLAAEATRLRSGARLFAVLGDPIAHSRSPALHSAALAHFGLPHRYVAIRCSARELPELLAAAAGLPVRGLNLTAPLKEVALAHMDRLTPAARAIGAVNTVTWDARRRIEGDNTDACGFVSAWREASGRDPSGIRALLLGAGGAARAVAAGLLAAGAARVLIANRTPRKAVALVRELGRVFGASRLLALGESSAEAPHELDLLAQCTSLGVGVGAGSPEWDAATAYFARLPWTEWPKGRWAIDLVYHPETTAFLHLAAERGHHTLGGLGMLVHQAAQAFSIWTGRAAGTAAEVMAEVVRP